jgi:O-antigen/teichoic acid export membrane protein
MDKLSSGSKVAPALSLRRNVAHAAFGKVVFALTQLGILSVVTHLGTPEDVGAMTVASALVTPLFFLTSMGMRDVHAVDDLDRFTRADYVAVRLVGGILAVLIVALLAATYLSPSGWIVQAAAVAFAFVKFFGAQSSLNHGIFQRAERLDFVSASVMFRGLSGLCVFALAFWLSRNLPLALAAEAAAWFVTNLFDQRLLSRLGARTAMSEVIAVRPAKLARLAWWVLPLGVSLWLSRTAASVPPLVLERYADLATVGVFGAMAYLHTALSALSHTLGSASAARLRRLYRTGEQQKFARLAIKLTLFSAILGASGVLIAWFAGDPILGVLFGEEYKRSDLLVVVLLASAISITGGPLLTAISAGQAFRSRLTISGTVLVIGVIVAFVLIPRFGAFGAAWALVVTNAANLLLTMLTFRAVSTRIVTPSAADPAEEATPDNLA